MLTLYIIDASQKRSPARHLACAGGAVSEILEQSQLVCRWKMQEMHVLCSFSGQVFIEMGVFSNIGNVRVNLQRLSL